MSDNDRLAEIDGNAESDRRWLTVTWGPENTQPYTWAYSARGLLNRSVNDRKWLIARLRELGAQAARDAAALDAVAAFRDYATSLTLKMKREYRTTWTEEETAEYVRLQKLRDDALAAREETE